MYHRAHKIRMYPNKRQEAVLRQHLGAARFVYNWALATWNEQFEQHKLDHSIEKPNFVKISRRWTQEHPEWAAGEACPRTVVDGAMRHLNSAFTKFFRGITKVPRFKKKRPSGSYAVANDKAKLYGHVINLPYAGCIRLAEELRFRGHIMGYTVSHNGAEWYVSVQVDLEEDPRTAPTSTTPVGIDVGISHPAVSSDGTVLSIPLKLKRLEQRKLRQQQSLSRAQKGSSNSVKKLRSVQRTQAKMEHIKQDQLHKFTSTVTKSHGTIVIEDLDLKSMMEDAPKHMRRCLSDSWMGTLHYMLGYKAQRLVKVDRYFPSSKTCSGCGSIRQDLTLSDRTYICPHCGLQIDRDLNAAINLMNTVGHTEL